MPTPSEFNLRVERITDGEDPVSDLATIVVDMMMENELIQQSVHHLVCRDMNLDPKSMFGGDEGDKEDFYETYFTSLAGRVAPGENVTIPIFVTEDDPRYELYWERTSNLYSHIAAQTISGQKYRWTKDFADRRFKK